MNARLQQVWREDCKAGSSKSASAQPIRVLTPPHPARTPAARVIMRNLDVALNVDGLVTMLHDYTQVSCSAASQPCCCQPPPVAEGHDADAVQGSVGCQWVGHAEVMKALAAARHTSKVCMPPPPAL